MSAPKLLIVDDTETIRAYVRTVLGTGYTYYEAKNGLEALDVVTIEQPDLILLDINMPVMNGLETLKRLKEDPATAAIPVVMVTTRGEDASIRQSQELGCAAYITKPIDTLRLNSVVAELLDQKAPETSDDQQIANNLLTFLRRLHGNLILADALTAVTETLISLIGTEDFAIFIRDGVSNYFEKVTSLGKRASDLAGFESGAGPLGAAAMSGQLVYGDPVAIVPLAGSAKQCVGLVAIFSLLHSRLKLDQRDSDILELMASHVGLAFEACLCASTTAQQGFPISRVRSLLAGEQDVLQSAYQEELAAKQAQRMAGSLVVRCYDKSVAFPLTAVMEVFRMVAVKSKIPGAPNNCLGLIDYHGQLIPLFDLAARLGLGPRREDIDMIHGHVVLVYEPNGFVGYSVDDLQELREEAAFPLARQDKESLGSLVIGAVPLPNGRLAPLVDESLLLTKDSREILWKAVEELAQKNAKTE